MLSLTVVGHNGIYSMVAMVSLGLLRMRVFQHWALSYRHSLRPPSERMEVDPGSGPGMDIFSEVEVD